MAWLAVDKIVNKEMNTECIHSSKPKRHTDGYGEYWGVDSNNDESIYNVVELPKGSIKKLIGRDLTWEDEPVEI